MKILATIIVVLFFLGLLNRIADHDTAFKEMNDLQKKVKILETEMNDLHLRIEKLEHVNP